MGTNSLMEMGINILGHFESSGKLVVEVFVIFTFWHRSLIQGKMGKEQEETLKANNY